MRLVHRRNNPNKETLMYIPLSHATGNQAYRIRVANHMEVKQKHITRILNIITGITGNIKVSYRKHGWNIENQNKIHNSNQLLLLLLV